MPLNLGDAIEAICGKITSSSIIRTVLHNPIWTSLLILVCIMLMAIWVFRDVETFDESLTLLSLRLAGYLSLLVMGVVFLHDQATIEDVNQQNKAGGVEELLAGADDPVKLDADIIPVTIGDPEQS